MTVQAAFAAPDQAKRSTKLARDGGAAAIVRFAPLEELENGGLLGAEAGGRARWAIVPTRSDGGGERSVEVRGDDRGMDVTLSADSHGVAEALSDV